ncbi:MAG: amidase family protein [Robiginitomaculum sp.]|nr:amidase family protein [Robiginitomaculum sp.]
MSNLNELSLAEALKGLANKDFSSRELTQAHLDAMAGAEALNAYLVTTADQALAMADASDERRTKAETGPLDGIPLGIKDLFCTKGGAHHGGQ